MQTRKGRNGKHGAVVPDRRQVLGAGIALAATSLLRSNIARAQDQNAPGANTPPQSRPGARRRLGTLEVSAVGLGGDPDSWGTSARRSAGLFGHRSAPEALNVPKLLGCKRFSQTGKVSPRIGLDRNDSDRAGEVPINTRSV